MFKVLLDDRGLFLQSFSKISLGPVQFTEIDFFGGGELLAGIVCFFSDLFGVFGFLFCFWGFLRIFFSKIVRFRGLLNRSFLDLPFWNRVILMRNVFRGLIVFLGVVNLFLLLIFFLNRFEFLDLDGGVIIRIQGRSRFERRPLVYFQGRGELVSPSSFFLRKFGSELRQDPLMLQKIGVNFIFYQYRQRFFILINVGFLLILEILQITFHLR